MRSFMMLSVLFVSIPIAARQPSIDRTRIATPVSSPSAVQPRVVLKARLPLPAIESVERAGRSPGPAADGILFNGEAIRIRGRNLGATVGGPKPGLRRNGRIAPVQINPNVPRTPTMMGAYVPALSTVRQAGLLDSGAASGDYELVLVDRANKVVAAKAVKLHFSNGQTPDFDGDGSSIIDGDCNDFDFERYPGNIEVCDAQGHDEDCDLATYGERDLDGDHFFDASCRNIDERGKLVSAGNDCDDREVTANPIRPERCPGATATE